jgi:hypothetical protein
MIVFHFHIIVEDIHVDQFLEAQVYHYDLGKIMIESGKACEARPSRKITKTYYYFDIEFCNFFAILVFFESPGNFIPKRG